MSYGNAGPDANPQLTATFAVELDGIEVTAFETAEIDGIEWTSFATRTGIDPLTTTTASGLKKPHTITLEKVLREGGAADIAAFYNWAIGGSGDRRSGAVIQNDREGNEVLRQTFRRAWVTKITPPKYDASEEGAGATFTLVLEAPELEFES